MPTASGDGPDAEDITSAAIERALRYRDRFDPRRGDAAAWLIGIARRCIGEHFGERAGSRRARARGGGAGRARGRLRDRLDLRHAVSLLDARDRELIALRYGADLTARQIGEVLDVKTNAVEVALHRALQTLRDALERHRSARAQANDRWRGRMTSHTFTAAAPAERRSLPIWSALSLLLPLTAVLAVAAANGGYFATAFGWTALAFAWVTLVAVVLIAPRWRALDLTWVVAAAALCVFTFCSALWAGSAGTAIDQGQRAVVYATAVAGALLLLRRRDLELWLAGLVFGATAICFYSLGTRLFADHFGGPKPDYRLFVPIGYWNALGIFAGVAALLAFGAAVVGRVTALRVLAGVALVVLLPTLYYTYSRGAWAALLAGLFVTLLYSPWRERLFVALFVFVPLPALAVWLASRHTRPDGATDGWRDSSTAPATGWAWKSTSAARERRPAAVCAPATW